MARRFFVGIDQRFIFNKPEETNLPDLKKVELYIHIPFCKVLCPYCPYNRIAYNQALVQPYLEATLNEIDLYYKKLGKIEVTSIYIGGGTPTNLIDELEVILECLRKKFFISGDVCIETSPVDLNVETIKKIKRIGVDLISIGVQSFDDKHLKALGRKYNSKKAEESVKLALSANFKSVNIDLMFVLPNQGLKDVLSDLDVATRLGVDQITTYPLFTFPYTSVGQHLKLNKIKMPDMFKRRKMYKVIFDYCIKNGYQQVSVWGFKKGGAPKFSSVTRESYIGIGAGACSKLPGVFYFNTFPVKDYMQSVADNVFPIALTMTVTSQLEKYYWLYWRFYDTKINKNELQKFFGAKDLKIRTLFLMLKTLGLCKDTTDAFVLTEKGSFYLHLLQNYFILNYINKVWTVAKVSAWPEKIEI